MKHREPLTDLERQKAHNIRETHPEMFAKLAREIMKMKEWDKLNTHGNPKGRNPKA